MPRLRDRRGNDPVYLDFPKQIVNHLDQYSGAQVFKPADLASLAAQVS